MRKSSPFPPRTRCPLRQPSAHQRRTIARIPTHELARRIRDHNLASLDELDNTEAELGLGQAMPSLAGCELHRCEDTSSERGFIARG